MIWLIIILKHLYICVYYVCLMKLKRRVFMKCNHFWLLWLRAFIVLFYVYVEVRNIISRNIKMPLLYCYDFPFSILFYSLLLCTMYLYSELRGLKEIARSNLWILNWITCVPEDMLNWKYILYLCAVVRKYLNFKWRVFI